uniref:Phosphatidylinositol specific phospholipase C X domain containing 1 n=1 Tax=Ornithorhynchus anatinus TaxID=9258 RepID=A0A6I8NXH6_ORNAN
MGMKTVSPTWDDLMTLHLSQRLEQGPARSAYQIPTLSLLQCSGHSSPSISTIGRMKEREKEELEEEEEEEEQNGSRGVRGSSSRGREQEEEEEAQGPTRSPSSRHNQRRPRPPHRPAPCKELNVTEQLDCGIRYLDLRIAHVADGSEKNLHFVHMVYTTALVEDTLTEISEWLQQHPKEVVILACRNFEGMTDGLHQYLVSCIKNIFGDTLCPRDEFRSLQQLWERGYQVVVSYEDEETVSGHRELWPAAPYWWGDKVKADDLVRYLEAMKDVGRPDGLFVAGINLTENLQYVLAHPAGSLKKMTLPNLPRLEAWIRGQIPGPGCKCINIIAGDFVGLDDFVGDVIGLNEKLLKPWPGLRLPFVRSVAVTGRSPRAEHWTERLGEGDGIL